MAAHGVEEFDGGKGAVGDHDDGAARQPSVDLEDGLARPIGERLWRARPLGPEALGRRQEGEERQGQDAARPRHLDEQHGRQPAQPAGLHEVSFGGADRVAVDAARPDLGTPAPLDRVVQADHDRRIGRHEGGDQQMQQPTGRQSGRLSRAVEDAMEGDEIAVLITAEDPQHRRHGAPSRRQDGARE